MKMQTGCLHHTLKSNCRIPQGWMMSGTRTSQTVRRSVPGKISEWYAQERRHTKMPRNGMDFLHIPINKELFAFLSSQVVEFNCLLAKAIYVTSGKAASIGFTIPCTTANMKSQTPVVHALEQEA